MTKSIASLIFQRKEWEFEAEVQYLDQQEDTLSKLFRTRRSSYNNEQASL